MKNKDLKKFIVFINLGHRIAKVRTLAFNANQALLKVFSRFNHRQRSVSNYTVKNVLASAIN